MANLTALKVRNLRQPGRYCDGFGLYLVIRPNGSKAWVQHIVIKGRRRDLGLGGYPDVSLGKAREKVHQNRSASVDGRLSELTSPAIPTFHGLAEMYIAKYEPTWRNGKTAINCRANLAARAYPALGNTRVDKITRGDVLDILDPIWTSRPAAARKLRHWMKGIFAYAIAREYIEYNPAGETISPALPPMPSVHFRALPYENVPDVFASVDTFKAGLATKLCFRFLILTAVRSGEARGATWGEIDLGGSTWTIPANRMKANRQHRVPLSQEAIAVLEQARILEDGCGLVFPSPAKPGHELSDMTLTKLLRDNNLAARATIHGFRASFRSWTLEKTDTPWAIGEAALAHAIGNSTEQAYARSDLFERRQALMEQWAQYTSGSS